MSIMTSIIVVAWVLASSASAAFANDQFDMTIYRPVIQNDTVGAYAHSSSRNPAANGGAGPSKLFSPEEKAMFERAQGAAD
jgi:hypothetical protein